MTCSVTCKWANCNSTVYQVVVDPCQCGKHYLNDKEIPYLCAVSLFHMQCAFESSWGHGKGQKAMCLRWIIKLPIMLLARYDRTQNKITKKPLWKLNINDVFKKIAVPFTHKEKEREKRAYFKTPALRGKTKCIWKLFFSICFCLSRLSTAEYQSLVAPWHYPWHNGAQGGKKFKTKSTWATICDGCRPLLPFTLSLLLSPKPFISF